VELQPQERDAHVQEIASAFIEDLLDAPVERLEAVRDSQDVYVRDFMVYYKVGAEHARELLYGVRAAVVEWAKGANVKDEARASFIADLSSNYTYRLCEYNKERGEMSAPLN
jgi:hypothetical protein